MINEEISGLKPLCEIMGECDRCGCGICLDNARFVKTFNDRLAAYSDCSLEYIYSEEKKIGFAWSLDCMCNTCFEEDWECRTTLIKNALGLRGYIDEWDWAKLVRRVKKTYNRKVWDYTEYLQSETWIQLREEVLKDKGSQCLICGNETNMLHHKSYRLLYTLYEDLDLIPLCHSCHKHIHSKGATQ